MKTLRRLFLTFIAVGLLQHLASAAYAVDAATVKDGKIYSLQSGQQLLLVENLTFADKIEVSTNGTFKVADGERRSVQAGGRGKFSARDGWLIGTDAIRQSRL